MDITEEQQQQIRYPYHQQQQPPSSLDPSQSQSYEAYYAYPHHPHHQQQYYDPSSYLFYDYSSTQTHPPPAQIHHLPEHQPPPPGASMAALPHLSQLAGEMDAAEKSGMTYNPYHPYPHHYPIEHGHVSMQPGGRGGGRRGGGPFRGRGRRGGGGGRGRGRGWGRGGGRRPHQSAQISQPTAVPTPAPPAPILPVAWCDICRVECTSLDILEQHKNGKRHKKTAQRFEERQKQQKLLAEYQAKSIPNTIDVEAVEANEVSAEPEIIPTAAAVFSTHVGEPVKASGTDDNNAAVSSGQVGELTKVSATDDSNAQVDAEQNSEAKGTDPPGPNGHNRFVRKRGGGTKRKLIRYGRGGKRLKIVDPPRRAPERPRVCTLCKVMCDTAAVFECHIAGKKHISKIKRCQGQGTVFGPVTVDVPPNQPSAYPTRGQDPLYFGLTGYETIQQATDTGMSSLPTDNGGKEVAVIGNTDPLDPANAPLIFESKEPNLSAAVAEVTDAEIGGALDVTEDDLPVYDDLVGDDTVLCGLDADVEQPAQCG